MTQNHRISNDQQAIRDGQIPEAGRAKTSAVSTYILDCEFRGLLLLAGLARLACLLLFGLHLWQSCLCNCLRLGFGDGFGFCLGLCLGRGNRLIIITIIITLSSLSASSLLTILRICCCMTLPHLLHGLLDQSRDGLLLDFHALSELVGFRHLSRHIFFRIWVAVDLRDAAAHHQKRALRNLVGDVRGNVRRLLPQNLQTTRVQGVPKRLDGRELVLQLSQLLVALGSDR